MLCQPGALSERLRRTDIIGFTAVIPAFRFQHIDMVDAGHEVDEAAFYSIAHFPLFVFDVQCDHRFSRLKEIQDKQFHEVGLTLTGVAKDEDVGRGLVLISLVEVHHDIGAILILADIEAAGICFAAVVEGIQIGHRACRQHSFELLTEGIVACGVGRDKALLLTKPELVHVELAPH